MDAQETIAPAERLAYPIRETCQMLGGISAATFFELKRNGKIKTIKIGNRTLVPRSELERLTSIGRDEAA